MVIKRAAFFLSLSFPFFILSLTFSGLNVSNIFFFFFSFLIYYEVLACRKISQFLLVAEFEIISLEKGSIFIGRGLCNIFLNTLEIGSILIGHGF
jgi:hypothetical protein